MTDISPASNRKTGLVSHPIYLEHDTGGGHPETPYRLEAIIEHLKSIGLFSELDHIDAAPASLEWIGAIHSPAYIQEVEDSCKQGIPVLHSPDTPISARSYDAALMAAGGVLAAVDAVMDKRVDNALCAVRPPGHHALSNRAMGFCLCNNVAIGARYIQKKFGLPKVLIVDWDVHHGNATQDAFYNDPSVLYFSIHQYPFYPGSGAEQERGSGAGQGFTVNVPLPGGCGDREYASVFEEILKPRTIEFNPDFIIISAGFDAHEHDPLGGMRVSSEGFGDLTGIVRDLADECCEGRLISALEGGYDPGALAESVAIHLSILRK